MNEPLGNPMWPGGPGIVVLPTGVAVRARALRAPLPPDPPDFGVYLLGRPPPRTAWSQQWIPWRDFRLPDDRASAIAHLLEALERAEHQRVEVACAGGRGRTGTALAVMAVAAGVPAAHAVQWVRDSYQRRAVETPAQRRWIEALTLA